MVRVVSKVLVPFVQKRGLREVSSKVKGIHSGHPHLMAQFAACTRSETSLTPTSTLTVIELIAWLEL